jgi:hypothetical protein
MKCACGRHFCFSCHGDPHWPLPCELLPSYHALLRKHAHFLTFDTLALGSRVDTVRPAFIKTVVVWGKNCPNCGNFIEKDGGCPFMTVS